VAYHEDAVLGHDEIGFDVVGTLFDGKKIGNQGVLRNVAARAAMADDNRLVIVRLGVFGLLRMDGEAGREQDRDRERTNRAGNEPPSGK